MKLIFVFGSNEAGRHGAGAARFARENYGAIYGQGFGPMGLSFAIPTKDWIVNPLSYDEIKAYVNRFIVYARINRDDEFKITAIGCGLAGHRSDLMAQLFKYAPDNCSFDRQWEEFLPNKRFWGTF